MLESWRGICPGRALVTHRGAEIVFCTWEPVEVSHQWRNKGRGVLERWQKQQCGHRRSTALLWNLGPDVEKGGSLESSDCLGTCQAGREESMLATSQMVPRLLRANECLTLRKDGVCHFYCYKMNTVFLPTLCPKTSKMSIPRSSLPSRSDSLARWKFFLVSVLYLCPSLWLHPTPILPAGKRKIVHQVSWFKTFTDSLLYDKD